MKWTLRQKTTVISLLALCTLFGIYVLSNLYALQAKTLISFDPADYGLPPQIGGYQVIAAVPSENMDCAAADGLELMLYPLPDQPQTLIRESLDILEGVVGRTIQTSISYIVMTLPEVKSHVEYLNKERWPTGCTLIHKHMVTLTSKPSDPTPVSSYEPAYWGLPEVIAGYRILAVKTVDNTPCLPSGAMGLTLQSSEPDMDSFLTNAPGDKVQKELEKFVLKPEKWLLEYVGPGVTKESVILALRQLYEGLNGTPCFKLGPRVTETPNAVTTIVTPTNAG